VEGDKVNSIEYSFQHYNNGFQFLLFEIKFTPEEGTPYHTLINLGHQKPYRNISLCNEMLDGRFADRIRWTLETVFDMDVRDSGWFSKQINDDFIKYIESKGVTLSKIIEVNSKINYCDN
jgi:hypothetical protein